MSQRIYPDQYGTDTWDPDLCGTVHIHLVNSEQYEALTGSPAPPSPITAATYAELGLPWFDLYDEGRGDVAAPERLRGTQSLGERDRQRGAAPDDADRPVTVDPDAVIELPNEPD
jgi:hypothetical protein